MPSFKLKRRVLCGRRYTSPSLVLFGIIFGRVFAFYFLSFQTVSHGQFIYYSVSIVSFWFEFADQSKPVQRQSERLQSQT